jgi:hypothetical protein
MRAGPSFSYPPISLLLRQPLSIKKSLCRSDTSSKREGREVAFIVALVGGGGGIGGGANYKRKKSLSLP